MAFKTGGIGHIAIRVKDLAKAREFYIDKLGFEVKKEAGGMILADVGGTLLGILGDSTKTRKGDKFNPYKDGLDHLALSVPEADLESLKAQLDAAGIPNNGTEHDELLNARYISFYDPEGIAW